MAIERVSEPSEPTSKPMFWAGVAMSALPAAGLLLSGGMKVAQADAVLDGFPKIGWPTDLALTLGIVELACVVFYLIPQTAVLGAILVTGYLGGAVATHLRIGESVIAPIVMGVLVWGGLFLRDARVRALIPLRRERG